MPCLHPRKKLETESVKRKTNLRWLILKLKSFLVKVFPDTSSTTSIKQALQRRFGIMWRCSCKDQLVNDMKITQLNIPTHQMNTKFVNNLPAYWEAYEPHAKKTLKKQEQSTSIVDPLAYVAHTTTAPVLPSPSTSSPQPTAQSPNDALMATMTQIANLLSGFQKQFPPTNNQLRTSSNSRNIMLRQCKEPKRKMDSQYFKDKALLMEAKEKGDVLDAEAEAFLADVECTAPYDQPQTLTTTNK
ncbi:hypothetical protein Tco_0724904 [Tanacetum coccineum]|uniref:No apical meristem-associated C-terminal domain-containing protein n=1 Tax=Tanacetum coccineum TaxID=301880 RepID=A0ABQ4YCV6_9ASTR